MRIGYFTSIDGWGGSEMYLLRLMQGVRERGHDVLLFGVAGSRLWEEAGAVGIERVAWRKVESRMSKVEIESEVGGQRSEVGGRRGEIGSLPTYSHTHLPTHVSQSLRSMVYGLKSFSHGLQSRIKRLALACVPSGIKLLLGNLREVLHLWRLFKAHPVDVMHVNVHGYEVAGIACRLAGIPSIGVYCISVVKLQSLLQRSFEKWSGKAYKIIVGKSKFCLEGWLQHLGLPPKRGVVVYNGVDPRVLKQSVENVSLGNNRFRFVSTGRLHPMKGYDLLIEAFALAHLENCELVIAGEGEMHQALEGLIANHHLVDRVFLAGHVENIVAFLREANAFLLPSVSHESFGQSVVEAMACGLPVITSDFGPFPEINIHGETGWVVPAGNVKELSTAMKWMLQNNQMAIRMGLNGKIRVQKCFSHKAMVDTMIQQYTACNQKGI